MIDQEALQAYRSRWQAVAEIEALEQQEASVAERWRQLNALWRMAAALSLPIDYDDQSDEAAHQRWTRLQEIHSCYATGSQVGSVGRVAGLTVPLQYKKPSVSRPLAPRNRPTA